LFLLACSLVALPGIAWAQTIPLASAAVSDTTVRHSVRLLDGTTLVGRIVDIGADSVRVQIDGGTVVVARKAVESVQQFPISHLRNGSYWFENPHGTRLLFSSTAFPLEKGSGYYANTWIFLHTFAGGLTDRFTLGGGVLWFPGLSIDETFLYLLPKYTVVDGEKGKLAIGALAGWLPYYGEDDTERLSAGLLYGVGTTGNRDSNLSLGLGWGYAGRELATRPVVMIGGQGRVARRISLISENWFLPVDGGTEGVLSYGLRFLGESLSVDLAFLSPFGAGFAVPWVGFAFRF
jgi:hypothetical protein